MWLPTRFSCLTLSDPQMFLNLLHVKRSQLKQMVCLCLKEEDGEIRRSSWVTSFCFRTFTFIAFIYAYYRIFNAYYPQNRKHIQCINVGSKLDQTICNGIITQCEVNGQNHNFAICNSFPQKMISPNFLRPAARTQQTFGSLPDSELFFFLGLVLISTAKLNEISWCK